jgi:hypothetical protein
LIRIELEYKSSRAFSHYRVEREDPREGRWIREEDNWVFVLKNGEEANSPDPYNKCRLDENRQILLLRSAKEKFDLIVCWEKDEMFEENMEVIELKKILTQ